MVTAVGDDMFADATIRNLEALGIDTSHVRRVKGKPSGLPRSWSSRTAKTPS
jgi:ribokinase